MIPPLFIGRGFKKSANPDANGWYDIFFGDPIPRDIDMLVKLKNKSYHVACLNKDGEWVSNRRIRFITHYKPIIGPVE